VQQGTTLEHYRIVDKLGEGGMGVVYRAEDTKLRREVAIKVLPEMVANDPDRLGRFEREAHLLAALNHGRIAAIYGLEESAGVRFLVMELVPGENLEQNLAAGRPEIRRALEIGKSVAEALEEAHGKGIIHRDLKPANVMVTPDGRVKVLDLGLAKALTGDGSDGSAVDVSMSPTVAVAGTAAGVILGTAAYMSPEQARGKELDARTDIWSFGCLLYEVLVGRKAFTGETVSDLMASILKEEPDWTALPADVPMGVRQLLQRCLQKDARRRLQAIGDARIELDDALRQVDNVADGTLPSGIISDSGSAVYASGVAASGVGATMPDVPSAPRKQISVPVAAVLALIMAAAGAAGAWMSKPTPISEPQPLTRLAIPAGDLRVFEVAISADGRDLVVGAQHSEGDEGEWTLYRRSMESGSLQPIDGAVYGYLASLSANGDWIAFMGGPDGIKRLPLAGGTATLLTDNVAASTTLTVIGNERVLYGDARRGLSIIDATGGEPRRLAEPDPETGETLLLWPSGLPGGRHALYMASVTTRGTVQSRIMVIDLESGERQVVLENGARPQYTPSGHLVFSRGGTIWAAEFDLDTRQVVGDPVMLVDGVFFEPPDRPVWTLGGDGTLVFQEGQPGTSAMELVMVAPGESRSEGAVVADGEQFEWPALSPDGGRIAAAIHGADQHGVWVYDVARGTRIRVSFVGNDGHAIWSPDGKRVVFYSGTSNGGNLYSVAADGSDGEQAQQLTDSEGGRVPRSFSPDGRYVVFTQVNDDSRGDVLALDLDSLEEQPLLNTSYDESWGMVSPDGLWLAYTSNESGTVEVYLRPFMRPGPKIPVSNGGGDVPTWSPDGRELYFRVGRSLLAVGFTSGEEATVGDTRVVRERLGGSYYPVAGSDELLLSRDASAEADLPDHLVVIPDFFDEIRRRLGER